MMSEAHTVTQTNYLEGRLLGFSNFRGLNLCAFACSDATLFICILTGITPVREGEIMICGCSSRAAKI